MSLAILPIHRIRRHSRLTILATVLAGLSLAAAPITKGPYLQAPAPDSMTIRWETHKREPGTLRFGEGTALDRTIGPIQPVTVQSKEYTFHVYEANLTGLSPNTSYSYDVSVGRDSSAKHRFKTFGTNQEQVTFIAYGDTRTNPDRHAAVAANFMRHSPEFILHSGDLVARGSEYQRWSTEFFDPLKGVIGEVPMLPSIGNHEDDGATYLAYFREPGQNRFFYSCDIGPVHVLSVDYRSSKATDEQFKFVEQDLEASRAPWKIVFVHAPMFNFGGHASLWGHEAYLPLFRRTQVDMVLAGHSHLYERFRPLVPKDSPKAWAIQHVTTGGGGAPLSASIPHPSIMHTVSTNHFIVFNATRDRIDARAIDADGREIDTFTLQKKDGVQPAAYLAQAHFEEDVAAAVKSLPPRKKKK